MKRIWKKISAWFQHQNIIHSLKNSYSNFKNITDQLEIHTLNQKQIRKKEILQQIVGQESENSKTRSVEEGLFLHGGWSDGRDVIRSRASCRRLASWRPRSAGTNCARGIGRIAWQRGPPAATKDLGGRGRSDWLSLCRPCERPPWL
jgi:hypothetical protein